MFELDLDCADDDDDAAPVFFDGAAVDAVDDDDDDKNGTMLLTLWSRFCSIKLIILFDECGVLVRASKTFSFSVVWDSCRFYHLP